ncbi:protein FLOURY 1-like [Chenopodium quinoa]|uniref:protein FLOURY 1-like n=1 Tax=Chenopodium quinoa TaxID=63459 RepID=UPI000B778302|nr:protein FLOURY 1-like [Chenopodium quinoa]
MAALYLLYLASKGATFLSFLYKISRCTQFRLMGRLCFLIVLCSIIEFYKRVLLIFQLISSSIFLMDCVSNLKVLLTNFDDFGCGFLIFGCFSKIFNVFVLFCMFFLGFMVLQCTGICKFRGKSSEERKGFSLICSSNDEINGLKKLSFENGTTKKMSRVFSGDQKFEEIDEVLGFNRGFHDGVGRIGEEREDWKECCHEDQVFDVITLRKMVKIQRQRAYVAQNELEKERMAATSSVDEAMAMILRLQNEKSVLQMQVNQLQRVSEEKQLHDQEVNQSLQWNIMRHESERSILEDQLRMCREKLKVLMKGEEWDQFDSVCPTPSATYSSFGSRDDELLIGSLDFESSPM